MRTSPRPGWAITRPVETGMTAHAASTSPKRSDCTAVALRSSSPAARRCASTMTSTRGRTSRAPSGHRRPAARGISTLRSNQVSRVAAIGSVARSTTRPKVVRCQYEGCTTADHGLAAPRRASATRRARSTQASRELRGIPRDRRARSRRRGWNLRAHRSGIDTGAAVDDHHIGQLGAFGDGNTESTQAPTRRGRQMGRDELRGRPRRGHHSRNERLRAHAVQTSPRRRQPIAAGQLGVRDARGADDARAPAKLTAKPTTRQIITARYRRDLGVHGSAGPPAPIARDGASGYLPAAISRGSA